MSRILDQQLARWRVFAAASLLLALAALLPRAAQAQGGVTGSIVGYVFDQAGQPLKGIKIVAKSATQIGGAKSTYTNDEGFFRFVGLLPGDFQVTASAKNLKTVEQKGITVGVGASAELNLIMEVETGEQQVITVIEKAPIISTTTATVKEVYDAEFLDNLPLDNRSYEGIVGNNTPGAVSQTGGLQIPRIRGGSQTQSAFLVDGFFINGQRITTRALAAFEVSTAGAGAEAGAWSGGVTNMVTKAGSNKFEFDINGSAEANSMRFFLDPAIDTTAGNWSYIINPSFAGPIIKDRLWYYVNIESNISRRSATPDVQGIFPTNPPQSYLNGRGSIKLTWQVTSRNKLQSFTQLNRHFNRNILNTGADRDALSREDYQDYFTGFIWESTLTDSLLFRSQIGFQRFWEENLPVICERSKETCDHIPSVVQTFPRNYRFDNHNLHQQRIRKSVEFINKLEWFGNTRAFGDHNVKLQNTYYIETNEIADSRPGDAVLQYNGLAPDRYTWYYSNDPRDEPARYGYLIRGSTGIRNTAMIQDSMRLTRHFTLTPGLNWIYGNGYDNRGGEVIKTSAFAPSVVVAWDATHDGRTVLRSSFSSMIDMDVVSLSRHKLGSQVSKVCQWNTARDANEFANNRDKPEDYFDQGCAFAGGGSTNTIGLPCGPSGIDAFGRNCQTALKMPRTWEYTAGAGREIIQGVGVDADFVYRQFTNQFETVETNLIWNRAGSALDPTGGSRNGRIEMISDLETPAEARRRYTGITTSIRKREGALNMTAAYTWSKITGSVLDTTNNEYGNIYPRDVYLLDAPLLDDTRHTIRAQATYRVNRWLSGGLIWRYVSGSPYRRLFRNDQTGAFENLQASRGTNPGANINDPTDDRPIRLPDQTILNLQVRVNLKPVTGVNVEGFVDVLNTLALRTVTAVQEQDGPLWGTPTSYLAPFRLRLGVRYRY